MFTLTWITEKELGRQMRNASGQVKMSGIEKIKANMNTGNKHIRQFLHKNV